MTIPSRPAPPPPVTRNQRQAPSNSQWINCWDDTTAQETTASSTISSVKKPPPRPPPPKPSKGPTDLPLLKKPGQQQSKNILSNLFGKRTTSIKTNKSEQLSLPLSSKTSIQKQSITSTFNNSTTSLSNNNKNLQLISFDSPPSSPTLTQKSSSDCVSVDSFSSDSNSSPLNNYSASQTESGFEDDFLTDTFNSRETSKKIITNNDSCDPFSLTSLTQSAWATKPIVQPKPIVIGKTSFFAPATSSIKATANKQSDFLDPLSNGRCIIAAPPVITMPTIIKPNVIKSKSLKEKPNIKDTISVHNFNESEEDTLESLPMPNCPPPPPPPEIFLEDNGAIESNKQESYGLALYSFNGDQDDDLNFKENEKIYLIEQLSDEWMLGRNKSGCVGMVPINYIDIKVPLKRSDNDKNDNNLKENTNSPRVIKAKVLYDFIAEVADDLSITANEIVTVHNSLDSEWLYGEIDGRKGQFPANYVEFIQ